MGYKIIKVHKIIIAFSDIQKVEVNIVIPGNITTWPRMTMVFDKATK